MKILAVDDDGIALNLLQECLRQGGYEYTTLMSSPGEVVRALESTAIPYDCILLDIEMPEVNGIDLCAEIRQLVRYRSTPILMITNRSDHASIKQAFENGATDYILKPFEFFEVLTRIRVAEQLVQERQAAIDSYMQVKDSDERSANSPTNDIRGRASGGGDALPSGVVRESLIPLSTLHNYLDRATTNDGCKIDLFAVKIRQIGEIFERTTAVEFLQFIELVASSASEVFGDEKTFIAHAGHGVFLCASHHTEKFDPAKKEKALVKQLSSNSLPKIDNVELEPEAVIGTPLLLTSSPKLNFKRAVKAAMARMETREGSSKDKLLVSISV